jgi:hypothetical protein
MCISFLVLSAIRFIKVSATGTKLKIYFRNIKAGFITDVQKDPLLQ